MSDIAEALALRSALDSVAQAAMSRMPGLRDALAGNIYTSFSDETFVVLATAKPKLKAAPMASLVARKLTDAQRDWVLTNETRPAVLAALAISNELTASEQRQLVANKGCKGRAAEALYDADSCLLELREGLAGKAGGLYLLKWLADERNPMSDQDVADWLARFAEWAPFYTGRNGSVVARRNVLLARLFEHRPQLLGQAISASAPLDLVQAATGCRHLTDVSLQWQAARLEPGQVTHSFSDTDIEKVPFLYQALGHNPVCDLEVVRALVEVSRADPRLFRVVMSLEGRLAKTRSRPTIEESYESLDDIELLDWLVRRSCPSTFDDRSSKGRPFDVAALARNPHLNRDQAQRLLKALKSDFIAEEIGAVALTALEAPFRKRHPDLEYSDDDFVLTSHRLATNAPFNPVVELDSRRFDPDNHRLSSFTYDGDATLCASAKWLSERFSTQADPELAWMTFLGITETLDQATTLSEAAELATLVTQ